MTSTPPPPSTRRAIAWVYVAYLLRYLSLIVLIPFYGRVLGVESYGQLMAAMSLYQLVWLLVEYGFSMDGSRSIAMTASPAERGKIYGMHMSGRFFLCVPALVLGAIGTYASPILRTHPEMGLLATLMGVLAGFNLGWFFQGTLRFRTGVWMEVIGLVLAVPPILILVDGPADGWKVLACWLVASIVSLGVAHGIALRALDRPSIRLRGGVALSRAVSPLFLHRGSTLAIAHASTFILGFFGTPAQVGAYGAAERLITVLLGLMQPANQVLVGTVSSRLATTADGSGGFALIRKSFAVMMLFGVSMMLGSILLGPTVVPLIFGPGFDEAVTVLMLLALLFPLAAFSQVASTQVLVPMRQDALLWKLTLTGSCATVALMLVGSWRYDHVGMALARVAGAVALAAAFAWAMRRTGLWARVFPS